MRGAPSGGSREATAEKAAAGQGQVSTLVADHPAGATAASEGAPQLAVEIIEKAFSCASDSVAFVPAPAPPGEFHGDLLRSVEMFLAGVRAMSGFEPVHEALSTIGQRLVLRHAWSAGTARPDVYAGR